MSDLKINIEVELNADPATVYKAWLDSEGHENITGGGAHFTAEIGSPFSAWDGYITGKILELTPETRVLQTWRTSEFDTDTKDSIVEVIFEAHNNGTLFKLIHTELKSEVEVKKYKTGWEDHYVAPMKAFFNN